jgi:hypothetical protein
VADKYGGTELPAIIPVDTGFPEVSSPFDVLLGYFADFIKTVMEYHCADIWASVQPNLPIVKSVKTDDPATNLNEQWLPALFIYRPGRETREVIEKFEWIAEDYRLQKGRVVVQWILNPSPQENRRRVDQVIDLIRKAVDSALEIGRHPAWVVPGDTDPLAATQGSSLLDYTGAGVIELDHAGPGLYEHKMLPPAQSRKYEELKMSFFVEELLQYDLDLKGGPHETAAVTIVSPDQGTGLGPFTLEDAIYE